MVPLSGRTIVFHAGTPVPLCDEPMHALQVTVQAFSDNSDVIWIGGNTTSATTNSEAGLRFGDEDVVFTDVKLNDIYIDAITDEDGVTWMAELDI